MGIFEVSARQMARCLPQCPHFGPNASFPFRYRLYSFFGLFMFPLRFFCRVNAYLIKESDSYVAWDVVVVEANFKQLPNPLPSLPCFSRIILCERNCLLDVWVGVWLRTIFTQQHPGPSPPPDTFEHVLRSISRSLTFCANQKKPCACAYFDSSRKIGAQIVRALWWDLFWAKVNTN